MNELKESLYDTSEAIALSLHLSGAGADIHHEQAENLPYVQFAVGPKHVPPASRPIPQPSKVQANAEPGISLPTKPFENGKEMLKWCIEAVSATYGFVIDAQGFVILREGEGLTDDGCEGAGGTCAMVVDQLNQMDIDAGKVQVANVIFQNRFMLIVHAKDKDGDIYNMGIVGPSLITTNQVKTIYQQVRKSLLQVVL